MASRAAEFGPQEMTLSPAPTSSSVSNRARRFAHLLSSENVHDWTGRRRRQRTCSGYRASLASFPRNGGSVKETSGEHVLGGEAGPRRGTEHRDIPQLQQEILADLVPLDRRPQQVSERQPVIREQPR